MPQKLTFHEDNGAIRNTGHDGKIQDCGHDEKSRQPLKRSPRSEVLLQALFNRAPGQPHSDWRQDEAEDEDDGKGDEKQDSDVRIAGVIAEMAGKRQVPMYSLATVVSKAPRMLSQWLVRKDNTGRSSSEHEHHCQQLSRAAYLCCCRASENAAHISAGDSRR